MCTEEFNGGRQNDMFQVFTFYECFRFDGEQSVFTDHLFQFIELHKGSASDQTNR